jgi:GDPmannose 4,6-dehydratase
VTIQTKILITGVTGQDGSFLVEKLLNQEHVFVFGLVRRSSNPNYSRIHCILNHERFKLVEGDITDLSSLIRICSDVQPDLIYNLASQSFVPTSWTQPLFTAQATGIGAVNVFEAVRITCPSCKVYQASSSEMFGLQPEDSVQNEETSFYPRSPYACAKVFAHQMAINYRESHNIFISCGILFNHESERRGEQFVTRKIARAAARISKGLESTLSLGRLDTFRDWGFAGDYVDAMMKMMELDTPEDFVIATGVKHSVEQFVDRAFSILGLNWKDHVVQDSRFMRPAEVPSLCGDASKAKEHLEWIPSVSFDSLVNRMVESEFKAIR